MQKHKRGHEYDLILVLGYFRRLSCYLNIVKYLGDEFRIGLFPIPLDEGARSKHRHTQEEFTDLCLSLGAELVEDMPVSASVALIPQQVYSDDAIRSIRENLRSRRRVAMMGFAWAGLHDEFLKLLEIRKILVIHKAFYEFLFRHRRGPLPEAEYEIVEVGLPYKKYPVFPDFRADYLLAVPTPFSFPTERDKWDFLETVLSLFENIDSSATVVHKPHNAVDYDYFSGWKYRRLARFLRPLPNGPLGSLLRGLCDSLPGSLGEHFGRLYTALVYEAVMRRVVAMEDVTPHHYCAMEAFLPGVKKGVIGGLSNTIWGALYFGLPFYNAVDINRQDRRSGETLYRKDASQLLDLNLRFFNVPYCRGRLAFDAKHFDIIDESTRAGDLIAALRTELTGADGAPE